MRAETIAALRVALADPEIVDRYWSHVQRSEEAGVCWLWTSAISGKGHGRFQVGDTYLDIPGRPRRRRTFVVIAHRFGFALAYGIDALLDTPLVGHRCDVPLCQLPDHWRTSNHRDNGRDYASRRGIVRGPLSDTRGARGRARAVRDAARAGGDVERAASAGLLPVHRDQLDLFDRSLLGRLQPAPVNTVADATQLDVEHVDQVVDRAGQ